MRRLIATCLGAALALGAATALAGADGAHLELAAGITPTFLQDPAYEAFSAEDMRAERFGADLRVEAVKLGYFRLVPFVAYRTAADSGEPYGAMDLRLRAHDFAGGLRLRTWFRSWIGAFLDVEGGVTYLKAAGTMTAIEGTGPGVRAEYRDKAATWLVGGMLGVELRLPPAILKRRGVDWLGFGLELGAGYLRRGEVRIEPTLEGGDENSLALADTAGWGGVNLSGWTMQIMFTVSLF